MLILLLAGCAPALDPDPFGGDLAGWLEERGCERPPSDECTDHDCASPEAGCFPVRASAYCQETGEADEFVTEDLLSSAADACRESGRYWTSAVWGGGETPNCSDSDLDDDDPTPSDRVWCEEPSPHL